MQFEDYHRTVIGYHGTSRSVAEQIVLGKQPFGFSRNDDDWLGNGVYFWEHAPQQALSWAISRSELKRWDEEPVVLGAMIRLGHCFDLLDPANIKEIERFHTEYVDAAQAANVRVRENANSHKYLDCTVFEFGYAAIEGDGRKVDTARAVYVPTGEDKRVWKRSWIYREAHIQICVRNPKCILGVWLVTPFKEVHAKDLQQPSHDESDSEGGEAGGSDDA